MWVRWAKLQTSNVKFLRDSMCEKWLKSVHFWRSYSKNKNVSVFIPKQCIGFLRVPQTDKVWFARCSSDKMWCFMCQQILTYCVTEVRSRLWQILCLSVANCSGTCGWKMATVIGSVCSNKIFELHSGVKLIDRRAMQCLMCGWSRDNVHIIICLWL